MADDCTHDHGDNADFKTWAALGGDAVGTFTGNAYWFALVADLIREVATGSEPKDDILELSWPALGTGIFLALLCLFGTMKCHLTRNTNYQNGEKKSPVNDASFTTSQNVNNYNALIDSHQSTANDASSATSQNINSYNPLVDTENPASNPLSSVSEDKTLLTVNNGAEIGTTGWQKIALALDYVSHIGEYAGPFFFVFDLATTSSCSPQNQLIAHLAFTTASAFFALADVRTCKNNLIVKNRLDLGLAELEEEPERADWITKIGAVGEFVANITTQPYWSGGIVDDCLNLKPYKIGLSIPGMIVGSLFTVWMSPSTYYAHLTLNENNQTSNHPEKADLAKTRLHALQHVAVGGDSLSHVCDIASQITFVADLATKHNMSPPAKIITQCAATLFSTVCSLATIRTCRNSMKEKNFKHRSMNAEPAIDPHALISPSMSPVT